MKIIGLQGVHSTGQRSVVKVLNMLEQYKYKTAHVQYNLTVLETYDNDALNKILDDIEPLCADGDVLIGHSAGCLLIVKLLERLLPKNIKIPVIWFFNAGLNGDVAFPSNMGTLYNIIDSSDVVTAAAELLPCSLLGGLGHDGYSGPNSNVIDLTYDHVEKPVSLNHGDFFEDDTIGLPVEQILQSIASI